MMATVKGVPDKLPGFIAAWDVAADGSLSKDFKKIALPKGGLLPFSMTLIPGQNSMLVTDAAIGFDLFDTGKGGRQSNAVPINGQGATCWSSFSPKTKNLYLTDIKTSIVTEVNVDAQLKGKVVKVTSLFVTPVVLTHLS